MKENADLSLSDEQESSPALGPELERPGTPEPTLRSRREPKVDRGTFAHPSSVRPELVEGRVLGGRYRVKEKLGTGGMGEVWSAEHVAIHMKVAVKLPLARTLRIPEVAARFEREAILLGLVRGDYLPHAIDFLVDDFYGPVLVTEFLEGESLAHALTRPLSVERAIDVGIDLAAGLAELHRAGVVHRDLKPGNVILHRTSDGKTRAVIIDLGVSRIFQDAAAPHEDWPDITASDSVVGTVEYMAPEQILHSSEVTAAADLYALGALLFRAVAGAHVFGAGMDRVELVRAKLTCEAPALETSRADARAVGLAAVLARALKRNPAMRYQSATRLRDDLLRLRDETPSQRIEAGVARPEVSAATPAPGGSKRVAKRSPSTSAVLPRIARGVKHRVFAAAMIVTLFFGIAVCARAGYGQPQPPSSPPPAWTSGAPAGTFASAVGSQPSRKGHAQGGDVEQREEGLPSTEGSSR